MGKETHLLPQDDCQAPPEGDPTGAGTGLPNRFLRPLMSESCLDFASELFISTVLRITYPTTESLFHIIASE